jgi:hypothetical protein
VNWGTLARSSTQKFKGPTCLSQLEGRKQCTVYNQQLRIVRRQSAAVAQQRSRARSDRTNVYAYAATASVWVCRNFDLLENSIQKAVADQFQNGRQSRGMCLASMVRNCSRPGIEFPSFRLILQGIHTGFPSPCSSEGLVVFCTKEVLRQQRCINVGSNANSCCFDCVL